MNIDGLIRKAYDIRRVEKYNISTRLNDHTPCIIGGEVELLNENQDRHRVIPKKKAKREIWYKLLESVPKGSHGHMLITLMSGSRSLEDSIANMLLLQELSRKIISADKYKKLKERR